MDPQASRTIEVASLGRPFSLGMLYDCRQDSVVPGKDPLVKLLNSKNCIKLNPNIQVWEPTCKKC